MICVVASPDSLTPQDGSLKTPKWMLWPPPPVRNKGQSSVSNTTPDLCKNRKPPPALRGNTESLPDYRQTSPGRTRSRLKAGQNVPHAGDCVPFGWAWQPEPMADGNPHLPPTATSTRN